MKHHSYPLEIIQFCLAVKLRSSASFRAIREILIVMHLYLGLSIKAPSHATILLWVKKYGYHYLTKMNVMADDWVILLDESVQFGQSKLLVIYGIRESQVDFTRPLKYQDLTPLVIHSRASWNGDTIKQAIEDSYQYIGKVKYAVADHGNSIKRALRLAGIPHVYDLTHCMALTLKHIYTQATDFQQYTKKMAHLRGTQALSKMSHVLPPAQRINARFMNLKPLSDWGMAVLALLQKNDTAHQDERIALGWVRAYQVLIKELHLLNQMIHQIQSILKSKGISKQTLWACKKILKQGKSKRLRHFRNKINMYFRGTMQQFKDSDNIVCCSDILESAFGKYKNYLQDNPMIGITNLSLCISAFTAPLEAHGIKEAIENTTVEHINQWTKDNIGQTTLSKRIKVLKMEGT